MVAPQRNPISETLQAASEKKMRNNLRSSWLSTEVFRSISVVPGSGGNKDPPRPFETQSSLKLTWQSDATWVNLVSLCIIDVHH
jgi:hypothetical protein